MKIFLFFQTSKDVDEFVKKEVKTNSPRLLAFEPEQSDACTSNDSGQLFTVVDKAIFLEIEGPIEYTKGLLLLLAMYYCFNLE